MNDQNLNNQQDSSVVNNGQVNPVSGNLVNNQQPSVQVPVSNQPITEEKKKNKYLKKDKCNYVFMITFILLHKILQN